MFSLKDKVLVVTGGNGLLGKQIITRLKEAGAIAIAADINVTNSDSEIHIDITSEESVRDAIHNIVSRYGKIDGWVNNAYPRTKDWGNKLEYVPFESWRKKVD